MTKTFECYACGDLLHADTSADEQDTIAEVLASNGWSEVYHKSGMVVLCDLCIEKQGIC